MKIEQVLIPFYKSGQVNVTDLYSGEVGDLVLIPFYKSGQVNCAFAGP